MNHTRSAGALKRGRFVTKLLVFDCRILLQTCLARNKEAFGYMDPPAIAGVTVRPSSHTPKWTSGLL